MVRLRAGLPFFSALEEMLYYGVDDPYQGGYAFYQNEILYPYIITADEIVTTWEWSNVEVYLETHNTAEWVNIIESEFNHHEDKVLSSMES
jgi:hypothetical protein